MAAQDTWMQLEDTLNALITAAIAPGGALGVQPNPDGSTGIKLVERVAPPEQEIFPSIGLMCTDVKEVISGSNKHDLVTTFAIVLTVRQPHDPTIPSLASAALQNLRAYQDDGAGNGLSPLLRDNVTLLNMCQWSQITDMHREPLRSDAEGGDTLAVAFYSFETHDTVRLT